MLSGNIMQSCEHQVSNLCASLRVHVQANACMCARLKRSALWMPRGARVSVLNFTAIFVLLQSAYNVKFVLRNDHQWYYFAFAVISRNLPSRNKTAHSKLIVSLRKLYKK